jgi:hypothetical protein
LGGNDEPLKGELWNPHYTGLLLNWQYALFAITVIAAIIFAIWQFVDKFIHNPKSGLVGLAVIVLFGGLLLVSYSIGNGTPLPLMNEDVQQYNTPFWLKMTDMWLFSTYVMTVLVILAVAFGSLKKVIGK